MNGSVGAGVDEFELIRRHLAALGATRSDVVLGPGDDAALVQAPPGRQLAMTMDTVLAGRHFPHDLPADSVGHRALAVNLSDLAAMGAEPAWALMSLAMPSADETWLAEFAQGLGDLARRFDVAVAGGDLVQGPLAVSIQLTGFAPARGALRRDGARVGDEVWVSGALGGAMAALEGGLEETRVRDPGLHARFAAPQPRVNLGRELVGIASSAIDVSDGLAADLLHVLDASGVGAAVRSEDVPVDPGASGYLSSARALELALSGGDDYELCFTAPPDRADAVREAASSCDLQVSRIGYCVAGTGLSITAGGRSLVLKGKGWNHFGAGQ
jgi:thiamine-monophosphate kinase